MTATPKRHGIPEPFPETIGVTSLTIWVPEDFCGDAEIIWWYPGKIADADKQRMTCSTAWLLQGIFHDVRGSRFLLDRLTDEGAGTCELRGARGRARAPHVLPRADRNGGPLGSRVPVAVLLEGDTTMLPDDEFEREHPSYGILHISRISGGMNAIRLFGSPLATGFGVFW